MPRIRNLKPEFFTSEDIVSLSPLARLFFQACWCEADKEGRMVWKPKTMKLRYFPADDCDILAIADEVVGRGLIEPYTINGESYAIIPKFHKHQYINPREAESRIPDISMSCDKTVITGESRKLRAVTDENRKLPADAGNSPDAHPVGIYIDSSLVSESKKEARKERKMDSENETNSAQKKLAAEKLAAEFEEWYRRYPRQVARGRAERDFKTARKSVEFDILISAVDRYAKACQGVEPQFIAHPATWLNGKRWLDKPTPRPNDDRRRPGAAVPAQRPVRAGYVAGTAADFAEGENTKSETIAPGGKRR